METLDISKLSTLAESCYSSTPVESLPPLDDFGDSGQAYSEENIPACLTVIRQLLGEYRYILQEGWQILRAWRSTPNLVEGILVS